LVFSLPLFPLPGLEVIQLCFLQEPTELFSSEENLPLLNLQLPTPLFFANFEFLRKAFTASASFSIF